MRPNGHLNNRPSFSNPIELTPWSKHFRITWPPNLILMDKAQLGLKDTALQLRGSFLRVRVALHFGLSWTEGRRERKEGRKELFGASAYFKRFGSIAMEGVREGEWLNQISKAEQSCSLSINTHCRLPPLRGCLERGSWVRCKNGFIFSSVYALTSGVEV